MPEVNNVMIVDDNDTDLLIARIIIEKTGFKGGIVTKNSGRGALEYLQNIVNDPASWPQLIFLDINMPVVNGFVFLYEFEQLPKELTSNTKIAVLTSSDNKMDMEKFFNSEFIVEFVPKPITMDSFKEVINKLQ
ncbi:MAG: response regulator [Cytophagales bacterium]|nr:response regulator [Cytophagales bacterium]